MDSHITMHNMRDKCIRLVGAFLIGYVFVVHMVIDASGEWNGLFHVIYTACVFSEFLVIFYAYLRSVRTDGQQRW